MFKLIKYAIIAFIIYVAYDNRKEVINFFSTIDTKEVVDATKKSGEKLVEKVME